MAYFIYYTHAVLDDIQSLGILFFCKYFKLDPKYVNQNS